MLPAERDELLIRIDEKVKALPKMEHHLEKINGHMEDHSKRITVIEVERKVEKEKQRVSKKAKVGYGTGVLSIMFLVVNAIATQQGWW